MKIQLKPNYIAILTEENGEVVGAFKSTTDAKPILEDAVRSHFDCKEFFLKDVTLTDNRDFIQPVDYKQRYVFHIHIESEEGYYVTLYLTYTPIY